MPVTSLLVDVLKAQANCWSPLPATFVFLILASLPLLIPGEQPKQNFNIPFNNLAQIYLLYHFHSFFFLINSFIFGRVGSSLLHAGFL